MLLRLICLLALFFSSCQNPSGFSRKALKINISADPQTLDPRKARHLTTVTLVHMLFEGLTRMSRTGEIELALAKDIEISEDGKRYVFRLRKSFWSNGDLVTSSDFATSWRAILDPLFQTDIAYQLYVIKNGRKAKSGELSVEQIGIQTPDPQTLVVELEQPTPYFLELISMASFFPTPRHILVNDPNWGSDPANLIGNGPFFLRTWAHSDRIEIVKNPRYWEAKYVNISRIDFLMLEEERELYLFEKGDLDWVGPPFSGSMNHFSELRRPLLSPLLGTYLFRVNTAEMLGDKKNPLSHISFRRALAISLDRNEIIQTALQTKERPAKSLVPPEMHLSENGYFTENHRDKAQSLLADALMDLDLSLTFLEPIKISYCNTDRNAVVARVVKSQWEEGLGIRVALEALESKAFFENLSQGNFQLATGSWTADFNDPINFLEVFKYKQASTNNTSWESLKYIDLLNRSGLCRDSEERKRLLREAEQILMEQMPLIPVFHYALSYFQREELQDVVFSPIGQVDFRWARIKSKKRSFARGM